MNDPCLNDDCFIRDRNVVAEPISCKVFNISSGTISVNESGIEIVASRPVTVILVPFNRDLSSYNSLKLVAQNLSHVDLLLGVRLVHNSPGHHCRINDVSFSGDRAELPAGQRKEFIFPRSSFGFYGFSDDWKNVSEIRINLVVEKTAPKCIRIRVGLSGFTGLVVKHPTGPRLTLKGLEAVLGRDCKLSILEEKENCGSLLRGGLPPPFTPYDSALDFPPPYSYPTSNLDEILKGKIMGAYLGAEINWLSNPYGFHEWTHFLNRHHFLRELAREALRNPGSPAVSALESIISDWIRSNLVPVGCNGGAGPSWETLSIAWRVREWLWIIGTAWRNEGFRKPFKLQMLCSVWEHANSLMDHRGHPNNWIIIESAALTLCGLCLPQFRDAAVWVTEGVKRLETEIERQFLKDGVHFEISPFYHAICLEALLEVFQASRYRSNDFSTRLEDVLNVGSDYLAGIFRPDFTWPSLNDSEGFQGDYSHLLLKLGRILNRTDLIWIGSCGKEGIPPTKTVHVFDQAGIVAMRSSFEADSNYVLFRAGLQGFSHCHEDALSLDLSGNGDPLLVDPGITGYEPTPLTGWYRSAGAHNNILVDGLGFRQEGMTFHERTKPAGSDFCFTSHDNWESATGIVRRNSEDSTKTITLSRTIIFAKPSYWILTDIITGEDRHEITICWQFAPGRVEVDGTTGKTVMVNCLGKGLLLVPACGLPLSTDVCQGSPVPPRGWASNSGIDYPAPNLRYRFVAQPPVAIVWVLFPFSENTPRSKEFSVTRQKKDSNNFEIVFSAKVKDVLTLSNPGREFRVDRADEIQQIISLRRYV
jgi:hypothetical protein